MFVCRALLEARPNIGRLAHAALSGSSHVNLTSRFDPKLCPSSADVDFLRFLDYRTEDSIKPF